MIDRAEAVVVTKEIEVAIKDILDRHGLQPKPSRTTYGPSLSIKLEAIKVELDEQGVNRADPRVIEWERYADLYGLPKDGVGRPFRYGNREYRITGLDGGRPRFPISADRLPDGKAFKFPVEAAKAGLR